MWRNNCVGDLGDTGDCFDKLSIIQKKKIDKSQPSKIEKMRIACPETHYWTLGSRIQCYRQFNSFKREWKKESRTSLDRLAIFSSVVIVLVLVWAWATH